MTTHNKKNVLHENEKPSLDVLQAGLFFLMNQYTCRQCPEIAEKIVEHLTMLCNHPHIDLLPSQNHLYARMLNIWRARQLDGHSPHHSNSMH